MKVNQQSTKEVRERHEEGVRKLDEMFMYVRERDGNGFVLAQMIQMHRKMGALLMRNRPSIWKRK